MGFPSPSIIFSFLFLQVTFSPRTGYDSQLPGSPTCLTSDPRQVSCHFWFTGHVEGICGGRILTQP